MKTFDDDFIRINGANFFAKDIGMTWPPPERLVFELGQFRAPEEGEETVWVRLRMSELTDEQREGMTHVCRGAEYVTVEDYEELERQHDGLSS